MLGWFFIVVALGKLLNKSPFCGFLVRRRFQFELGFGRVFMAYYVSVNVYCILYYISCWHCSHEPTQNPRRMGTHVPECSGVPESMNKSHGVQQSDGPATTCQTPFRFPGLRLSRKAKRSKDAMMHEAVCVIRSNPV